MTPHEEILAELREIKALLRGSQTTNATQPAPSGDFADEPIPQPAERWELSDAEAHCVHFGKNSGVRLADLKDTSLAFYAKEKAPQLKRDGTPFTDRPADIDLKNAARTIWHHRRGTLAGVNAPRSDTQTTTLPGGSDDEPTF